MNKREIAVVILTTGVLVLSGCGGSSSPTAVATPTPPPANGGTYATVEELKNAFVEAGGSCPSFTQHNRGTLSAESADCATNSVLSTYISSEDVSQLIQNNKKMNEELGYTSQSNSWLVGENWVINAPDATQVRENLGGLVVTF